MNTIAERENAFEAAIEEFDFKKVHMIMNLLGWTWGGSNTTPTVIEMRKHVTKLFYEMINGNFLSSSSGGFQVRRDDEFIHIEFIVESASG